MEQESFKNPFRPGAGHRPPYLAGRTAEQDEMKQYLDQRLVTQNVILTGLRGVGKTVLLETVKPIAMEAGWLWAGADMSESASVTEDNLALRILTDIAPVTAALAIAEKKHLPPGFLSVEETMRQPLDFGLLNAIYRQEPGLVSDKLKSVLTFVWTMLSGTTKGIVFAYDEAQNLADHAAKSQYPLALLLEVFQSLQRKGIPFLLVLTGLPTLLPKLIESRTYSERMFHVISLKQLDEQASREAIMKPIEDAQCPVRFTEEVVETICRLSGGYPYFIQFICKEIYDIWVAKAVSGREVSDVPITDIVMKLDNDFFQGRWARVTDRQKELLKAIVALPTCDDEFTVQEIVGASRMLLEKAFSGSHVTQMMSSLSNQGLVFKNRHGKYSLAVPLLAAFIRRQYDSIG
ncbi:MAG: ATP-binding protein [Burkholderiaceae bacterium]|nr:ATP-binding protein [Burkholderiaceae bacterium]